MKIISPVHWLGKLFSRDRKAEKMQLIQRQRLLIHHGLEGTAEVMGASLFDDKVGSLCSVRLWLKLKKADGNFIYTHSNTLVSFANIPGKGQKLRIKYQPDDLSSIVIL